MGDDRITGIDGISIATALALESLFNIPTKDINPYSDKGKIKPSDYDVYLINIHTLVRNILTSIPSETRERDIKKSDIMVNVYEVLKVEIHNITELCNLHQLSVMFYCPDYKVAINNGIARHGDKISFLLNKTMDISNYAFKRLIDDDTITNIISSRKVKLSIKENKVLMTTHFIIDLLNYKHFFKSALLESHTGRLILPKDYNRKYYQTGSIDASHYPFNEILIYLLGDKHMFKPVPIKLKRFIDSKAQGSKWKQTTSSDLVRNDVSKDTDLRDIVSRAKYIFN